MSIYSTDLNLLVVLHTVLSEQHVARAAERLHVTPSAVSNALARLRGELGDPLVTRKGRGIVPTPRALELAPQLARAIRELEQVLDAVPFEPATCTRTFTLAVADVGQAVWVPRIVAALHAGLPLARLRVVGIDALVGLGDLASPEIDLHLGLAGTGPGLHGEPLVAEPNHLVARKAHPIGRSPARAALARLRHVRVDMVPGKRFGDVFASGFAAAGIARDIAVTVPSYAAAAAIVRASDLVTMLPASLRSPELRVLPLPFTPHVTKLAMSWHDRTHADPAARSFREIVRAAVTSPHRDRA